MEQLAAMNLLCASARLPLPNSVRWVRHAMRQQPWAGPWPWEERQAAQQAGASEAELCWALLSGTQLLQARFFMPKRHQDFFRGWGKTNPPKFSDEKR